VASAHTESEPRPGRWQYAQDLWLEAFVLFNFFCLTGDILLAHAANSFRNRWEYLPVWFSPLAAAGLAVGLFMRMRSQRLRLWSLLGALIAWLAIALGAAGVIFHLDSHFFYERTLRSLTYAAPFAAPLAYMGLGCLLLMNRMVPARSQEWSKWVLFFATGGFAGNFVLSLTDHAVNGFFHRSEWIPVISSALAVGSFLVYLLGNPARSYSRWCVAVLVLQAIVGSTGFLLHLFADLHGPSRNLFSNVISGAPPFAPLLLPNLAILGFLGLAAYNQQTEEAS
jgi:uncharacterized membrane protein YgdD (TMEM256/DUF423 family)